MNTGNLDTLFITGAGVSAESGIPTFRGQDGYWTIGSENYSPQEMATRRMYQQKPAEFLSWYYSRYSTYKDYGPNEVHYWLANKNLITQNIDGLDGLAGNKNYIAIHGRIDKMTLFHNQGNDVEILTTPWDDVDTNNPVDSLLDIFNIDKQKQLPEIYRSYKPFVLLFDEYYTELYGISEAQERMLNARKMIFIGTSFSVNITQIALDIAINRNIPIEIVDPEPVKLSYDQVTYHSMQASEYINL